MLENLLFEHSVHVSLQHILYLLQLLLVNQIEKIVDEMDWALVKVKGDITASAAELTGERSAKTEHFDWKKNVYKWCFWWLVAQSAPCKPNRDFRTILLGFPCRQSPECYFRLEGSKEVFGQQRWFHLLCASCYVVCTEWKDDDWLDLN